MGIFKLLKVTMTNWKLCRKSKVTLSYQLLFNMKLSFVGKLFYKYTACKNLKKL